MRRIMIMVTVLSALLISGAAQLPAAQSSPRTASIAVVETVAGSGLSSAPLLAQYSSNNNNYSSSSSSGIPRGVIRLGIALLIGFVSFCAWILKRVFA